LNHKYKGSKGSSRDAFRSLLKGSSSGDKCRQI